jgi:hypothetical protein
MVSLESARASLSARRMNPGRGSPRGVGGHPSVCTLVCRWPSMLVTCCSPVWTLPPRFGGVVVATGLPGNAVMAWERWVALSDGSKEPARNSALVGIPGEARCPGRVQGPLRATKSHQGATSLVVSRALQCI